MKYIIDNAVEVCRNVKLDEIMDKMYCINDHISDIVNLLYKEFPTDSIFKNLSVERIINGIQNIEVDLDMAVDEFYLEYSADEVIYIEVVTKEVAEGNDKDFVNLNNGYTREELDTYEVGGTLSDYRKLSDKYYIKFM